MELLKIFRMEWWSRICKEILNPACLLPIGWNNSPNIRHRWRALRITAASLSSSTVIRYSIAYVEIRLQYFKYK